MIREGFVAYLFFFLFFFFSVLKAYILEIMDSTRVPPASIHCTYEETQAPRGLKAERSPKSWPQPASPDLFPCSPSTEPKPAT